MGEITFAAMPVTAASQPFGTVSATPAGPAFVAAGYVEEEFLITGTADVVVEGTVLQPAAPFCSRVLVRRPADPARFSGSVQFEPFHQLAEAQVTWNCIHPYILRTGDAWVAVTVNVGDMLGGGVHFLKEIDPQRYGDLRLALPDDTTLPPPGPGHEIMMRQLRLNMAHGSAVMVPVGAAIKEGAPDAPLAGHAVDRQYGSGWSGTGMFWQDFLDDRHATARLADGRPVFDGYLPFIHREPRTRPDDAVVAALFSEGEVWGMAALGVTTSPEDTGRFRIYEVPGSTHTSWAVKGAVVRPVIGGPEDHDGPHNDRSFHMLAQAVFANLDRCVRTGEPMPAAPRITRDADSADGLARDEHGNALGGLRNPWVDVPSARYIPRCKCTEIYGFSPLLGAMQAFDSEQLAALYGDDGGRQKAWADRVAQMATEGWLLPEDAAILSRTPE